MSRVAQTGIPAAFTPYYSERAVTLFRKAIDLAPHSDSPHSFLGDHYRLHWSWDKAIDAYRHGLALGSEKASDREGIAACERILAGTRRAVLEPEPEDGEGWAGLATNLLSIGRTLDAERAIERAIDLAPLDLANFSRRGQILEALGRRLEAAYDYGYAGEWWDEARMCILAAAYRDAIKSASQHLDDTRLEPYTRFMMARGYRGLGLSVRLARELDVVLELKADFHLAWIEKYEILVEASLRSEAEDARADAISRFKHRWEVDDHAVWSEAADGPDGSTL